MPGARDDVLARLDIIAFYGSEGVELRESAGYFKGKCPFHDDRQASLSVSNAPATRAAWKCHANCGAGSAFDFYIRRHGGTFAEALRAVARFAPGIVIPEPSSPRIARKITATYDYTDEKGELLFQTVRYEPKDFRQRAPDGKGGWKWNLEGVRRVLYRLPEVTAAREAGKTIFVAEGERDADNLVALGLTATTSPMGAGKWQSEYTTALAGAKSVVLFPDNDEPGRGHMLTVAADLARSGTPVRLIALPGLAEHGDATDWIAAGGSPNELAALYLETKPYEIRKQMLAERNGQGILPLSEIKVLPVTWLWNGMFIDGVLNLIFGFQGDGKSYTTLAILAAIVKGWALPGDSPREPANVMLVSDEDDMARIVRPRLEAMGVDEEGLRRITVLEVEKWHLAMAKAEDRTRLENIIIGYGIKALVIDPLANFLGSEINENSDSEVRSVLMPMSDIANRTGCAVIGVRHMGKMVRERSYQRTLGSQAWTAVPRATARVGRHPEAEGDFVILPDKQNYTPTKPGWRFAIRPGDIGAFVWGAQEAVLTAQDLDRPPERQRGVGAASEVQKAMDFLLEEVPEGILVPSNRVFDDARALEISRDTLFRAKRELGGKIVAKKIKGSKTSQWVWKQAGERVSDSDATLPTLVKHDDETPITTGSNSVSQELDASQTLPTLPTLVPPISPEDREVPPKDGWWNQDS